MEWQASATAPAVHHEHCDIPLQEAPLVKALQVDSSSFKILTGSSIFFSTFSAPRFEHLKTAGGRVLAFGIEWHLSATAPAVHHEHLSDSESQEDSETNVEQKASSSVKIDIMSGLEVWLSSSSR